MCLLYGLATNFCLCPLQPDTFYGFFLWLPLKSFCFTGIWVRPLLSLILHIFYISKTYLFMTTEVHRFIPHCFAKLDKPSFVHKHSSMGTCVLVAQSCPTLCDPMDCSPPGFCPWNSPGKNTGVDCHPLLQRKFPTQGLNPGLLHCRQILYRLSYKEV